MIRPPPPALLKTSRKDEIISAIRSVAEGRRVISPELEEILAERR